MPRARTQAWLRDELILALDLYRQHGRQVPRAELEALSSLLRALPVERELADDPTFRNPNAVQLKVYNFVAIDPNAETAGMSRGGRRDQEVWEEFVADEDRLKITAEAIRTNAWIIPRADAEATEEDIAEAFEGRILTRVHRVRERNRALVERKKQQLLASEGRLACEGCGFDFAAIYGERGVGFIECHHTLPVSELKARSRTRLADLALVCANCHRMIHRRAPWLTMGQLRELTSKDGSAVQQASPR
jgi:5-methylcytosine-specific restriction enzyme A